MPVARAYIRDGYNEEVFIKEVQGVYEAVTVVFRPMLPAQVREIIKGFGDLPAESQTMVISACLNTYLVKWNLGDDKGAAVPISIESISSIKKLLQDRLFDVVTGYDGGDKPPAGNKQGDTSDAQRLLENANVVDKKPDIAEAAKN